jgi:hypothetical protein
MFIITGLVMFIITGLVMFIITGLVMFIITFSYISTTRHIKGGRRGEFLWTDTSEITSHGCWNKNLYQVKLVLWTSITKIRDSDELVIFRLVNATGETWYKIWIKLSNQIISLCTFNKG